MKFPPVCYRQKLDTKFGNNFVDCSVVLTADLMIKFGDYLCYFMYLAVAESVLYEETVCVEPWEEHILDYITDTFLIEL